MIRILIAPVLVALAASGMVLVFGDSLAVEPGPSSAVFIVLALGTTATSFLAPRLLGRIASISREVLAVALAAMITTGATIVIASSTTMMVIGPSQLVLLAIIAGMGAAFGIVVEYAVARELAVDALRLRVVAAKVAAGQLDAASGVDRGDEIGQAARAIDMLARRLAALERERTKALGARQAFLAAIGHDLRTPLSALRAALDAVEDGLTPDPGPYFVSMGHNIEAIRGLVDDLFLLSRIEEGNLKFERDRADIAELADEAVEALTPLAVQRNVALHVLVGRPMVASIGIGEISRVLRNLLDNAIRHAPDGSAVRVSLAEDGGGILVRVTDQGDGIDPELRDRVFGVPVRTDRFQGSAGSAGLGLVIVRGLIEAHGGQVWIEDGDGGRVAFWIPETGADSGAAAGELDRDRAEFPERS